MTTSPKNNPQQSDESSSSNPLHDDTPPVAGNASPYAPHQQRRASTTSTYSRQARIARRASSASRPVDYDIPDAYANLGEAADIPPVQNPDDDQDDGRFRTLEQARSQDREYFRSASISRDHEAAAAQKSPPERYPVSRLATQLYTTSYLVFFSILGTLARLGLQALTTYPGTPVAFSSVWPNFAGSLVMGFLAEDRMLFQGYQNRQQDTKIGDHHQQSRAQARLAVKKSIPLYVGLATGFCGSFTSFSAFMRDVFLALSGDGADRNGGYSFLALVGVVVTTVSLSLSGLFVGAHLAIFLEPFTPSLSYPITRKVIDKAVVVLGWGSWLGAVLMSIFPLHEIWRGVATFALVFAPLGCLARFYISLKLNGKLVSFPLGTFVVNVLGTAVLGMSWDLAHVPLGGVVGCQVLQGVQDGFCGCLTTVSTWVAELAALRRGHAYIYGSASVLAGLAMLVAIMGGLKWSDGWEALLCTH